jgi:hypothetical protein
MPADSARVQIIVHRPSRHRAAVLKTAGPRMRVERVLTQLMLNRMPRHRAAAVSMAVEDRLTAVEDRLTAVANIPAGPTISNQSLPC